MIRLITTENGLPSANQREQFKQYASVPDNSRDALLESCLLNAMLAVQGAADVAILPCKFTLTADNVKPGESFRLYQGGQFITSVETESGATTNYTFDGERLVLNESARLLTVKYQSIVIASEAAKLMPAVWQYGTALYDGADTNTLNVILKQLYSF